MLPSDPNLSALKALGRQIEIKLFDPRELPQWPEWIEWWIAKYGDKMPFAQVTYHAPELQHRPTFRTYFPKLTYGKPVPTEQFLVYRLRERYADDSVRIHPMGYAADSLLLETGTPGRRRANRCVTTIPRAAPATGQTDAATPVNPICPHCKHARLEFSAGYEPYTAEQWQCPECCSTYPNPLPCEVQ